MSSNIELRAGSRPFMVAGCRIEPNSAFVATLTVAAALVEQGRAQPCEESGRAAVEIYGKAERASIVRRIESETRRNAFA